MLQNNFPKAYTVTSHSQKLQTDLEQLGCQIKHHECNLEFIKAQSKEIDDSTCKLQGGFDTAHAAARSSGFQTCKQIEDSSMVEASFQTCNGCSTLLQWMFSRGIIKNYTLSAKVDDEDLMTIHQQTTQQTINHILQQQNTAAGIVHMLKSHQVGEELNFPLIKDVLGAVATLGKVKDDNINRLLSEFLGSEIMLAIVCKTYEGVKALEEYDGKGMINSNAGLTGLGLSIGRVLGGRFYVICLEGLRCYIGDFVSGDPQRRLELPKPKLPSGDTPCGFLGYAVNMIDIDDVHLSRITKEGYGLRESLFYYLLKNLQVYRTRLDMQQALPFINGGAISLDGGMMKNSSSFCLGSRKDVEVTFATTSSISYLPAHIVNAAAEIKFMSWRKERLGEEIQREEALICHLRKLFGIKKQKFLENLIDMRHYMNQISCSPVVTVYKRRRRRDCKSASLDTLLCQEKSEVL